MTESVLPKEKMLTITDLRRRLNIGEETARKLCASGMIKGAFRTMGRTGVWRIPEGALSLHIAQCTETAGVNA